MLPFRCLWSSRCMKNMFIMLALSNCQTACMCNCAFMYNICFVICDCVWCLTDALKLWRQYLFVICLLFVVCCLLFVCLFVCCLFVCCLFVVCLYLDVRLMAPPSLSPSLSLFISRSASVSAILSVSSCIGNNVFV